VKDALAALRTAALACAVLGAMASATAGPAPGAARFHACHFAKSALPFRCATIGVYENRAKRAGRSIALELVELDAVHRSHRAVFWNPGGPGAAATDLAPGFASGQVPKELLKLRDTYDIVLLDNRGTGLSGALDCPALYSHANERAYFAQLFPEAALRACRERLAKSADLSEYTTAISSDDLDDVRVALGYDKIVLDGGSYGTMFYLDYARRHPAHVESMVLAGVAPPGFLFIPLEDAQGAQQAMNGLIKDCKADAACNTRYPHFAGHFAALVGRFDRGPVNVDGLSLTKEVFSDQLRHALYAAETAAYVPYIVEEAYAGNVGPLRKLVDFATVGIAGGLAMGLNLSVTCAEDVPFISEAKITGSSAGTFQGATRVRAQQRACAIWNVGRASASFVQPVRSEAPILMLSGEDDPATPPNYGREALRLLPNGRQIVIPHAGHDFESECTDALIVAFVRSRDAKRLDATHCVGNAKRPPFATSMKGFGA